MRLSFSVPAAFKRRPLSNGRSGQLNGRDWSAKLSRPLAVRNVRYPDLMENLRVLLSASHRWFGTSRPVCSISTYVRADLVTYKLCGTMRRVQ